MSTRRVPLRNKVTISIYNYVDRIPFNSENNNNNANNESRHKSLHSSFYHIRRIFFAVYIQYNVNNCNLRI